ncbi:hypothetical protein [Streptomyces spiralis]|uniref:hypothetical protein n=1 Tax=Streptomyces spiralis TaxID=66376 RepID=UPI0036793010
MAALTSSALPQIAYAAPAHDDGDGKGIVDAIKGWFTSDDKPTLDKPPSHDELDMADRQKLPKGTNAPKARRVGELTGRRTSSARFWQLSDGRVEAELSAVPTSYRDAKSKSWKNIDTTVRASDAQGFDFANTTNEGRSWFSGDPGRLVRFQAPDGRSVTLGLEARAKNSSPRSRAPRSRMRTRSTAPIWSTVSAGAG